MAAAVAPTEPALTPRGRRERLRAPLVTVGGLAAATLALHLRDPHRSGSWGVCPLSLAGIYCPGCGGLRAVNDLTHLDVRAAVSSNAVVAVGVPVVTVLLALWLVAAWRGSPARRPSAAVSRVLWWAAAGTVLAFTVLRNTPAGGWLAP